MSERAPGSELGRFEPPGVERRVLASGEFLGERSRFAEVRGLTLTDYSYRPAMRVDEHRHCHAYLSVVLHGGYEESSGGLRRDCGPGIALLHPAGERHADRFGSEPTRIFSVEFGSSWLDRAGEARAVLDEPAEFRGGAIAALALRLCGELARWDELASLAIEGLALELMAELARSARGRARRLPSPWLERARALIDDRFRERLALAEIADEVGVHPAHLVREFRRQYGTTVASAIRARRIELARRRLVDSRLPLAEIAFEAGFSQQSHFTALFRRATGVTPAEYRRRFAPR